MYAIAWSICQELKQLKLQNPSRPQTWWTLANWKEWTGCIQNLIYYELRTKFKLYCELGNYEASLGELSVRFQNTYTESHDMRIKWIILVEVNLNIENKDLVFSFILMQLRKAKYSFFFFFDNKAKYSYSWTQNPKSQNQ